MASGENPGFRGLPGQPFGIRGGRVGGRVGVLVRGQCDRVAQERHARHLQLGGQGFRYAWEKVASTAKFYYFLQNNRVCDVAETLGDGLERVVTDEAHEETRRRIRSTATGSHIAAGFRGLGLGILGGYPVRLAYCEM